MSHNNQNYHQNVEQKRRVRLDGIDDKAAKTKHEEGFMHEKMLEKEEKREEKLEKE